MRLTCRHQNHGGEEAHLLLAQTQVHQLLAEVKHGVQKVSGPHGPQGVHAVLLAAQKSDGAVLHIEQRGEANDQHLQKTKASVCDRPLPSGGLMQNAAYLKGSGLQQADLVVLGKVSEPWNLLGKLHHLPHSGGEALGELLPHLVSRLLGVHVGRHVHGTNLRTRKYTRLMTPAYEERVARCLCYRLTRYILLPPRHWGPLLAGQAAGGALRAPCA